MSAGGAEREAREFVALLAATNIHQWYEDLIVTLTELLEKYANEARLEEARWWSENYHHQEACDLPPAECLTCSHIADLKRAVGEARK